MLYKQNFKGDMPVAKSKEQNYLHGAAILTAGVVIMKILGFIYKVPLGNMLEDDGYGLFLSAYNVYCVFLTLATAGLPVALSRMISEAHTQGRNMQARRTFKVAWWTFFGLGAVSSLIMFFLPEWLATDMLHNPDAAESIFALSPAVLLVCLTSAYRGFCQGHENMIPTTVGQVIEVGTVWATVRTVIDISTNIGAFVAESGSSGMIVGDFAMMQDGFVKLSYLTDGAQVFSGDTVLTSGAGGAFPSGLVVGTIESVQAEAGGQIEYGRIKPGCDLDSLVQVFVVKDFEVVE